MSYKISIPEPCDESWQKMSKTEKGKFCSACNKEVVDFSNRSKEFIYNQLQQSNSLCGRFTADQLEASYSNPKNNWFPFYSIITAIGLSSVFAVESPAQQTKEIPKAIIERDTKTKTQNEPKAAQSKSKLLTATIVDSISKQPLIGAPVKLLETEKATITDIDGHFSILVDQEDLKQQRSILVSYVGYESKEILLSAIDFSNQTIQLSLNESASLGMVVTAGYVVKKPSLWQRFKNIFRKKR